MISTFQLKFGRGPGIQAVSISATPVTVFVGPNNSGKSKVLTEIEQFCRTGQKNASAVILEELTFSGLASDKALEAIERLKQPHNAGESLQLDHVFIGSRYGRQQLPLGGLTQFVQTPSASTE
jgi:ABC-type enterochelin transport system ATPase subunit